VFYDPSPPESGIDHHWRQIVQLELRHDLRLRAAASVIYDTVYPGPNGRLSFQATMRSSTKR
jgi:hypothetical protein